MIIKFRRGIIKMHNRKCLRAAAVLSMALPVITAGAAQAGVEKMFDDRMKGGVVYGYAQAYSSDWCELTYVDIDGQEERGASGNITSIYLYKQNYCNHTYTSIPEYYASVSGALVAPDNKLVQAELNDWVQFTVEHCDYSSGETLCTPGEARVSAKWTGLGNTYQGHSSNHAKYGPTNPSDKFLYISHSRYNGAEREANVEMQLEIDGLPVDFSGGYSYGTLRYVKSGSFTMSRITP